MLSPNSFAGAQLGMRGDEPQQLAADIARGSKDGGPNHEGGPIAAFAYLCKLMHIHAMTDLKEQRHRAIAELIRSAARSPARRSSPSGSPALGFAVTQATISRDLEQFGAVKVRRDGRLGYALPDQLAQRRASPRLAAVLRDWVRSIDVAGNLVVIKTPPGSAHLVGVALDQRDLPEVVGTICGDDTMFVAVRDAARGAALRRAATRTLALV